MKIRFLLTFVSLICLCSTSKSQDECAPEIGANMGEFRTALVDIFKSSRNFWETDLDDYLWETGNPLPLDINGYPTSLNTAEGRGARTLIWEALEGNYPTGTYTLLFDGEGTLELGMDAVNAVFTDNGGLDNRIVFEVITTTNEGIMVDITSTNPANYVRNIRIIRPEEAGTDYINTYADEPFIDLFYERHKYFNAIRYMDWMSTNFSRYTSWAERPTWHSSTWTIGEGERGIPIEVMVHVANRLHANPWFCMPHQADDNYMTEFATYLYHNLDPSLDAYIEYSNEVWNNLFGFADWIGPDGTVGQHQYALDMGEANGIEGYYERIGYWLGRRSGEMFDIFEAVFGGDERLIKVIPIQTGPDLATPHTLDYIHNGTPLYQRGDIVAGSAYFGGEYGHEELTNMTVTELLNHIETNMYNFDTNPYWCLQTIDMLNNPPYAESGLKFVAYEGGQHLANWFGSPEDNATQTLIDANRHPQMGDIYYDYYDWWASIGAGAFFAFTSIAEPSMFGAWGLLENIQQDTLDAPKWLATAEWIRDNACLSTALATVELDFQASQKGTSNLLEWQVSNAENKTGFIIEKLQEEEWTLLKEINLAGFSSKNHYRWLDNFPQEGLNYYKLKVLDPTGNISFEKVASVFYQKRNRLQIVPNVVEDVATLKLEERPLNHSTTFQIFNSQGQFIKQISLAFNQGYQLNVSELPSGVYFLKLVEEESFELFRFVKK